MTNEERADTALSAVQEFRDNCSGSPTDTSDGMAEAIADLICNMCHLAVAYNLDPLALVETGIGNYAAESIEPDGMFLETSITLDVMARRYGSGAPWQQFNGRTAAVWHAEAERELAAHE